MSDIENGRFLSNEIPSTERVVVKPAPLANFVLGRAETILGTTDPVKLVSSINRQVAPFCGQNNRWHLVRGERNPYFVCQHELATGFEGYQLLTISSPNVAFEELLKIGQQIEKNFKYSSLPWAGMEAILAGNTAVKKLPAYLEWMNNQFLVILAHYRAQLETAKIKNPEVANDVENFRVENTKIVNPWKTEYQFTKEGALVRAVTKRGLVPSPEATRTSLDSYITGLSGKTKRYWSLVSTIGIVGDPLIRWANQRGETGLTRHSH